MSQTFMILQMRIRVMIYFCFNFSRDPSGGHEAVMYPILTDSSKLLNPTISNFSKEDAMLQQLLTHR